MLAKLDMASVMAAKDIYDYIMQPFPTGLGKYQLPRYRFS